MSDQFDPLEKLLKRLSDAGMPPPDENAMNSLREMFQTMFVDPSHLEEIVAKSKEFVEAFFAARRAASSAGLDPATEVGGLSPTIVMANSVGKDMRYEYEYLPIEEAFKEMESRSDIIPEEYTGPLVDKFGGGVVGTSDKNSMRHIGHHLVKDLGKVPFMIGLVATIVPSPGFSAIVVSLGDGTTGPVPHSPVGYIIVGASRPNLDPDGPKFDFLSEIAVINGNDTVTWYKLHPDGTPCPSVADIMDGIAEATASQVVSEISEFTKKSKGMESLLEDLGGLAEPGKPAPVHIGVEPDSSDMSSYHTMLKKLQDSGYEDDEEMRRKKKADGPKGDESPKPKHHRRF